MAAYRALTEAGVTTRRAAQLTGVPRATAGRRRRQAATFIPTDLHFAHAAFPFGRTGGGGVVALATVADGAVWLGGGNAGISCVDPSTAAVRAAAMFGAQRPINVTYAGQHAFAIDENSRTVVRLTPPAACTP